MPTVGKIRPSWRCESCREIFTEEDEADDCCPPVEVYVCPECDKVFFKEIEARTCCPVDPDAPPRRPTPPELEALGQLRLIP